MKAFAALLALLCASVQAETRDYVLEHYAADGTLIATAHLSLEFAPRPESGLIQLTGQRTVDQVDDRYRDLIGQHPDVTGRLLGRRLTLTLDNSIFGDPLELEAVFTDNHLGTFHGEWKRFFCFSGGSGFVRGWPTSHATGPRLE